MEQEFATVYSSSAQDEANFNRKKTAYFAETPSMFAELMFAELMFVETQRTVIDNPAWIEETGR